MKRLAADLDVADYVTFTGRAPDAEMLAMRNTADVCVNPDEHNEMNDKSTMNKVMEYMALGKPIVQFDVFEGRFSAQDASAYARPNRSEEHTSELQSLMRISYAVFCLKKKTQYRPTPNRAQHECRMLIQTQHT